MNDRPAGPPVPLPVASVMTTAPRMLGEAVNMRELLCVFVLVVASRPLWDPRHSQVSTSINIPALPCKALTHPALPHSMLKSNLTSKVISNPDVLFSSISNKRIDPKMHVNFEKVLFVFRKYIY